jgi:aminoglycoside phosphotransferase (APT) family kinase protein
LDDVDIETVSNDALISLVDTAPLLYKIGGTTVVRLSKTLALKCGGSVLASEAKKFTLVLSKTDVRAPRVHRSFQVDDSSMYFGTMAYIVMDYIDGPNVGDLWQHLTSDQKRDIVNQTADAISQLQAIELPSAGPLGGGPCRGRFFTDYSAGPFNDGAEMQAWFNHKLEICKRFSQAPKDTRPFELTRFVLVHMDSSPRNMILDDSGAVWFVDWADAGAYPPALAARLRFSEFGRMVLALISRYSAGVKQLQAIEYGLTVASFA